MATKLYPPRLEGTLPAFYKSYDNDNSYIPTGASITIPFGRNPAVNSTEVGGVTLRLRTVSTNSYIITDLEASSFDMDQCLATFLLPNDKTSDDITLQLAGQVNEGLYYRALIAFKALDGTLGYYSTVGIIKCVAKPDVSIQNFEKGIINSFMSTECIGVYQLDTYYGDTTEKVYSYSFTIWDEAENVILTSGEKLHDATLDIQSDSSKDIFEVYVNLSVGLIYLIQYTVTTLNGLTLSSPKYKMMKTISVDPEFPIHLHGKVNLDEGYIELTLLGEKIELLNYDGEYVRITGDAQFSMDQSYYVLEENGLYVSFLGSRSEWNNRKNSDSTDPTTYIYLIAGNTTSEVEATSNSVFLITRSSSEDNYVKWQEIVRFVLNTGYPSDYRFKDFTVQLGITYKYAILQYNIHGIYSNQIPMSYGIDLVDINGKPYTANEIDSDGVLHVANELDNDNQIVEKLITADFEDMFLYDGERQLKIRFNPHVKSFKEVIPEQKIETIGSTYPYIFRNGVVNYKEFPIDGLISYLEDEALLFLTKAEANDAGILVEDLARPYDQSTYDILNQKSQKLKTSGDDSTDRQWYNVRTSKDLTSDNIMGERYFKLKVLDWLNDGNVKLFRSPTEGAYLVRLMNVSYTPEDALGRMLHNFTCVGYEIAELTYDNLVAYGIVHPNDPTLYETHWGSADVNSAFNGTSEDGFYEIPLSSNSINKIEITDFAPGDIIKVKYNTTDPELELTIGVTGSLNLSADSRTITNIWVKPNPLTDDYNDFSRSLTYAFTGMQLSAFDAIKNVTISSIVGEQYVGPQENVLARYLLRDHVYGVLDAITGLTPIRIGEVEGYNDLYNDLLSHNHISYDLTNDASKFTGHKIDILQVHKRDVIPIFARPRTENGEVIYLIDVNKTTFDVTPFGQPYVPTAFKEEDKIKNATYDISKFVENNNINYAEGNIIDIDPYSFNGGVNINDIYPLLEKINPNIDHFTILKAYIRNNEGEWVEPESYKYFDTYTNTWWEDNEKYDPTFSINDLTDDEILDENNPTFVGDNNIRMSEINDLTLYNLGVINKLRLGNGVVAEITFLLRIVDYDIEESEPVKTFKEDYLLKKENYFNNLYAAANTADKIADALVEEARVLKLLDQNAEQLKKYSGAATAIDAVLAILKARMLSQKIKLYNTAIERYEAIENLLKEIDAPLDENDMNSLTRALNENGVHVYNGDLTIDEVVHPNNVYENRDSSNRDIERYEFSTTPDEHIEWNYIYKPQYEAIIDENTALIANDEEEIKNRQLLIGNKNGYFSDFLNDELEEGTIIYYEQLIENQETLKDNLTNKYNEELEKLNDEIFEIKKALLYADLRNNNDVLLDLYTDLYILDNATALKERVNRLIIAVNQDLLDLEGRYNADIKKILEDIGGSPTDEDLVKLANDYLTELKGITITYADNIDWLSENYKPMMDYFMVLVEKKE